MAVERYVATALYYGVGLAKEHYLQILAVSESQLLRSDYYLAVFTVSDKGGTCAWSHDYCRIFAKVYCTLSHLIVHVDVAVVA